MAVYFGIVNLAGDRLAAEAVLDSCAYRGRVSPSSRLKLSRKITSFCPSVRIWAVTPSGRPVPGLGGGQAGRSAPL